MTQARSELRRLADRRPALRLPAAALDRYLSIFDRPYQASWPHLDPLTVQEKLSLGHPLLRGEKIGIDQAEFRERWAFAWDVMEVGNDRDKELMAQAPEQLGLNATELLTRYLNDPGEIAQAMAGMLDRAKVSLEEQQLALALRLAFFPVLSDVRRSLQTVAQGFNWSHGYCLVCGAWPLLGELRGLMQTRFLRCGLCGADWEFPRLCCAVCGCRDHRRLGYLSVEGEEPKARAATCDACGHYVKSVATLDALSDPALLVADLATLHLDLTAAEHGFKRP